MPFCFIIDAYHMRLIGVCGTSKNTAGSISKMTNKEKKGSRKRQKSFSLKEKKSDRLLQRASVLRNYIYRMKKYILVDLTKYKMQCYIVQRYPKTWKLHLRPELSMKVKWGFLRNRETEVSETYHLLSV